jgi:hypothetical protein
MVPRNYRIPVFIVFVFHPLQNDALKFHCIIFWWTVCLILALTLHNNQRIPTASRQESYWELKCLITQVEHDCTEMSYSIHFQGCTKVQGGMYSMTMMQIAVNENVVYVVMFTLLNEELVDTVNFSCSLCVIATYCPGTVWYTLRIKIVAWWYT